MISARDRFRRPWPARRPVRGCARLVAVEKEKGVTPQSLAVLHRLLRTQKMDGRVIGMLADEIKMASMREQPQ